MTKPAQPDFTPERCALRLRRLQAVVKEQGIDALVLVPGLDGNHSRGNQQAVGFLLEGHCGRDVLDIVKLQPEIEEVVLVVGAESVGMYATPAARKALWPLIAPAWQNLELLCSTEEEVEDPDLLDATKIGSFVQLLRGKSKVGFALTPGPGDTSGSAMEVEKWTLIQAYGLEGVGKPGFFSMNFQVVDVYQALQALYTELDSHHLDHLLNYGTRLMLLHWQEVVQGLSMCRPTERVKLSERQVGEPLLSYYAYGTLRPTPGVKQVLTMMPRVVFGQRTNSDKEQSSTLTAGAAGTTAGEPCSHFVVEAADPKSPLRAARTYFFSAGSLPTDCLADESDEFFGTEKDASIIANWSSAGVPELMRVYAALVEAAKVAITHFATNVDATAQSAREVAVNTVIASCMARGVPLSPEIVASQLRYALWAADHTNMVTPAPVRGSRKPKVLRLALHDISVAGAPPVGALVYADTFLEAVSPTGQAALVNLTEAIPQLLCFPAMQGEAVAIGKLESALRRRLVAADVRPSTTSTSREDGSRVAEMLEGDDQEEEHMLKAPGEGELLGDIVGTGEEDVVLLTGMDAMPAVSGRMSCFTGGLVFRSRGLPPLVIDFRSHLAGMWLQELGADDPAGDVIVLQGKTPACGLLPAALLGDCVCIGIALKSLREIARRHVTIRVIAIWEQACREMDIPLGNLAGITPFPPGLHAAHSAVILTASKLYPTLQTDLQVWDAFAKLDDTEAAAVYETCSLALANFIKGPAQVGVILITGLPGSHQEDVASALVEFETTNVAWQVVQLSFPSSSVLSPASLDKALASATANALRNATSTAVPRIALVVECFSSLASQLAALAACPACQGSAAQLYSVIVCCNATYLRSPRYSLPPGFMEQLHRGLVSNVVLSGPHDTPGMAELLQLRLPGITVVRSARGQLIRSLDALLSTERQLHAANAACSRLWPSHTAQLPSGHLQAVYLKCDGSLDVALLKDALHGWGVAEGGLAKHQAVPLMEQSREGGERHLIAVRALVRSLAGGEVQSVVGLPGVGVRVSKWPLMDAPWAVPPSELLAVDRPCAELLFFGSGLSTEACEALVERCGCPAVGTAPLRTLSSVTREERQAIAHAHREMDLPEGYYFDGTSYLDPFGDRLKEHPRLAEFLSDFVEKENRAIAERNASEAADSKVTPLHVKHASITQLSDA